MSFSRYWFFKQFMYAVSFIGMYSNVWEFLIKKKERSVAINVIFKKNLYMYMYSSEGRGNLYWYDNIGTVITWGNSTCRMQDKNVYEIHKCISRV